MKTLPLAEIDCDTGMYRVVYQLHNGGLVIGKKFDGTKEGFIEALKFAYSITRNTHIFCKIPLEIETSEVVRLSREIARGYSESSDIQSKPCTRCRRSGRV